MDTDRNPSNASLTTLPVAIWAITPGGVRLGLKLGSSMINSILYLPEKYGSEAVTQASLFHQTFQRLELEIEKRFRQHANHIFIFSTGIAVRMIAPLLNSKMSDPAVVVMDEKGKFAISLLSGHIGGANQLAKEAARKTGGTPVITTATDVNGVPSIDLLALNAGLFIETPENIKHVNMKLLEGNTLTVWDPETMITGYLHEKAIPLKAPNPQTDIFCSWKIGKVSRETLILRPKVLSLGVGCNRGTPADEILMLIRSVFKDRGLSLDAICSVSTTAVKIDEDGIIQTAKKLDCPLHFYTKEELNSIDTILNPSQMAEKYLGVKSVCEAAAILGAGKGSLMIPKQKTKNVTLAVAVQRESSTL